jgi:hypothetical protein
VAPLPHPCAHIPAQVGVGIEPTVNPSQGVSLTIPMV